MSTAFPDPSQSPWTNPDDGVIYFYESERWRPEADKGDVDNSLVQKETDTMTGGISSPNLTAASLVLIDGHTYSVSAGDLYFDGQRVRLASDVVTHSLEYIYEPRRNWSASVVETIPGVPDHTKENAFNFRQRNIKPQNGCTTWTEQGSVATLTIDPPIALDHSVPNNIRFWAGYNIDRNPNPQAKIKVNGIPATNSPDATWTSSSNQVTTDFIPKFDLDIGSEISSISWEQVNGTGADCLVIAGIWINGKQLVDEDITLPNGPPILESYKKPPINYNQDREWSTGISNYYHYATNKPAAGSQLFDGDIDTSDYGDLFYAYPGKVATLTFNPPLTLDRSNVDCLKFLAGKRKSNNTSWIEVNGIKSTNMPSAGNPAGHSSNTPILEMWTPTFASDIGNELSTITFHNLQHAADYIYLKGMWVNDKLLVDASIAIKDQIGPPIMWSDYMTGTPWNNDLVAKNIFDYNFGTGYNHTQGVPKSTHAFTLTLPVPLPLDASITDHLELWVTSTSKWAASGYFRVNGIPANNLNEVSPTWSTTGEFQIWKPTFDTDIGTALESITWNTPSAGHLVTQAIAVDGKYLVDSDVVYPAPECS